MTWLISFGILCALAGIAGLTFCMWRANRLRKQGLEGDAMADELRKLIPLNLGSLLVGVMGLMLVVIGRVLS
ncbi:MAG: hypothetical protein AAF761_11305 [Pseudomonadota bacterium]